ncbi:MAG: hypothetical protein DMF54_00680 [Acidobacteria bacterium]|nr:MAG: hypothetical protein DMF54_00680 [Acidobacteriota bacterium]
MKLSGRSYFAAKTNANFPANRERLGLPTIQGIVLLFDAESGVPLAVLDSIEITIRRTGAATAAAAKKLARSDSSTVTICGCGEQGRVQLEAIAGVLPIERGPGRSMRIRSARGDLPRPGAASSRSRSGRRSTWARRSARATSS